MATAMFQPDSFQKGLVIGRNGDFDIPLGFVFTGIDKFRNVGGPGHFRHIRTGTVATVGLVLEEVHWFQRKIDVIPRGHSAGLLLRGHGLDVLARALSALSDLEFLYLVGPMPDAES